MNMAMTIAVLMTVFNRKEKTLRCLDSLQSTIEPHSDDMCLKAFITDDGSTDGTVDSIKARKYAFPVIILPGTGSLFWNGGMINSWKAAINEGGFDGYLWLNDDVVVLPPFWEDLKNADSYCLTTFGKPGIYVGSTKDGKTGNFTYGGFVYVNKFTQLDSFIKPDGKSFQECEAAHGNITYVSSEVVESQGVFCEKYFHGGSDHDYTYLAHKAGWPILVLPRFSAVCENDHSKDGGRSVFFSKPLKVRWAETFTKGHSAMYNALLFSKRCFPWRYPFVWLSIFAKVVFPRAYYRLYLLMRGAKQQTVRNEKTV